MIEILEKYILLSKPSDRIDLTGVEEFLEKESPAWCYGRVEMDGIRFDFYPHKKWRLKREHFIPLSATIVSKELYHEVGGLGEGLMADYDLFLRLAKKADPIAIPNVIAKVKQEKLTYHEKLARINAAHDVRKRHIKSPIDRFFGYRTWRRQLRRLFQVQ